MKLISIYLLLTLTTLSLYGNSIEQVLLKDILGENNDVDVYIDGTDAEFEGSIFDIIGDGFYYGTCVRIHIVNSSDTEIALIVPTGTYLVSKDSLIQNMIISKTEELIIPAYDSIVFPIHAMCADIDKTSPKDGYFFTIGELKNADLLKLAIFLDEQNIQDDAGQLCVWAVSNDAPRYKLSMYEDKDGSLDKSYAILKELNIETRFTQQYEQRISTMRNIALFGVGFLILAGLSLVIILMWRKRKSI